MLNVTTLTGRIVYDPELRSLKDGTSVMSLRIACERDRKDESGNKVADFFDVVLWRNNAEYVKRYGSKGRIITVVGRLQNRSWTDKEGRKVTTTELVGDYVYFGAHPKDSGFNEVEDTEDVPF